MKKKDPEKEIISNETKELPSEKPETMAETIGKFAVIVLFIGPFIFAMAWCAVMFPIKEAETEQKAMELKHVEKYHHNPDDHIHPHSHGDPKE